MIKIESNGTSMSISSPPKEEVKELITDEQVLGLADEILQDIRDDATSIKDAYERFFDMVMNEGDASSASKEAIVNLLKVKSEMSDKKIKVMDLYMRVKLRERDTFPKYLVNNQKNTIVNGMDKKKLLEEITEDEHKNK
jgi:hypothetical protein